MVSMDMLNSLHSILVVLLLIILFIYQDIVVLLMLVDYHNGLQFTTKHNDNGGSNGNCAVLWFGAW